MYFAIAFFYSLDIANHDIEKFLPDLAHSTINRKVKEFRSLLVQNVSVPQMSSLVDTKLDIVEINESMFGKKQKYNKGILTKKTWLFCMAQRDTRKTSFHVVANRKNESS